MAVNTPWNLTLNALRVDSRPYCQWGGGLKTKKAILCSLWKYNVTMRSPPLEYDHLVRTLWNLWRFCDPLNILCSSTCISPQSAKKVVYFQRNFVMGLSKLILVVGWCLYLSWKCVSDMHFQLRYRHQPKALYGEVAALYIDIFLRAWHQINKLRHIYTLCQKHVKIMT